MYYQSQPMTGDSLLKKLTMNHRIKVISVCFSDNAPVQVWATSGERADLNWLAMTVAKKNRYIYFFSHVNMCCPSVSFQQLFCNKCSKREKKDSVIFYSEGLKINIFSTLNF